MEIKNTKERILDAAEELFAGYGYHSTSLRNITKAAKVNLAAVNYHFGSKEILITEVIERRLLPLNKIRVDRIDEVLQEAARRGENPDLESLIRAFIEPTLLFVESGRDKKYFLALIGRAFGEPDDTVRNIFINRVNPLLCMLMDILVKILPDVPKEVMIWRLHFLIGSMSHTMQCLSNLSHRLEGNQMKRPRAKELVAMLVQFLKAGLEAPIK